MLDVYRVGWRWDVEKSIQVAQRWVGMGCAEKGIQDGLVVLTCRLPLI